MSDMFSSDVTVEAGSSPLPVSGTVTDNQGAPNTLANGWPVEITDGTNVLGTVTHPLQTITNPVTSNTATITQVVATNAVNVTVLAANANRKKVVLVFPKGSASSFLKYGAAASSSSYTHLIASNNTEVIETTWTGQMDFNGTAQTVNITEMV